MNHELSEWSDCEGALCEIPYVHYRYYIAGATYGAFEGLARGTYGLIKVKFC